MSTPTPRTVVLLGAQRFEPTLGTVVDSLGIEGRIALITAGWQEREPEDEELSAHLGGLTVNLKLHARGNSVFAADREFAAAHRERQQLLRHLQEIYRIRLEHAFEAEFDVATYDAPAAIREEVRAASIEAIRTLDAWHIDHCLSIHDDFERKWKTASRPEVVKQREQIAEALKDCSAVAIAGGHVAVLLNRLDLFDLAELIGERAVFAWSAGAMAISDRVVLFHDSPPEGRVARQVLDVGLRFLPRAIVLPEPERRLDLTARERVSLMARRFAPSTCLAMPARSYAVWQDGHFVRTEGVLELCADGAARPFLAATATTTPTPTALPRSNTRGRAGTQPPRHADKDRTSEGRAVGERHEKIGESRADKEPVTSTKLRRRGTTEGKARS